MDENCPWGDSTPNLKGVRLTQDEKLWLGRAVCTSVYKMSFLCQTYNLDRRRLHEVVSLVRRNRKPRAKAGRPFLLDSVSIDNVRTYSEMHANCSGIELSELVIAEHVASVNRTLIDPTLIENIRPMCNRCVRNYVKRFVKDI